MIPATTSVDVSVLCITEDDSLFRQLTDRLSADGHRESGDYVNRAHTRTFQVENSPVVCHNILRLPSDIHTCITSKIMQMNPSLIVSLSRGISVNDAVHPDGSILVTDEMVHFAFCPTGPINSYHLTSPLRHNSLAHVTIKGNANESIFRAAKAYSPRVLTRLPFVHCDSTMYDFRTPGYSTFLGTPCIVLESESILTSVTASSWISIISTSSFVPQDSENNEWSSRAAPDLTLHVIRSFLF